MRGLLLAVAWLGLTACAATPTTNNDPYESANRETFFLNIQMDDEMLRPIAEAYVANVPEGAREAVHNFLDNFNLPVTFANDLLQAQPRRAGQTLARFAVNTSLGLGGLFDVATRLDIPYHTEDTGQTLAVWGVGDGPYLVLPLLGPSNPRDATGFVGDILLDPSLYIQYKQYVWWMTGRKALTILDVRARNIDTLDDIERNSLDFYATARSLYRQHRASEAGNGETEGAAPPEN